MSLPDYKSMKIPEGEYLFTISEEPEKRKSQSGTSIYIIFKFRAVDKQSNKYNCSDIIVPWEDRYKDLGLALGAVENQDGSVSLSEIGDVVGMKFIAEIKYIKNKKDPSKTDEKVINIREHVKETPHNQDAPAQDAPDIGGDDIPF